MPTITVVEDDELVRTMLDQHLTSAGFTVLVAPETATARRLVAGPVQIDLCLIDLVMPPEMPDGLEFARWFKTMRPNTPVILMTGYYAAARRLGDEAWPILFKPVRIEDLLIEIKQALAPKFLH